MKCAVKAALVFTAGAGIGGGVSWFVLKKQFDKKLEKHANDVSNAYTERIKELKKELNTDKESDMPKTSVKEESEAIERANAGKTSSVLEYAQSVKDRKPFDYTNVEGVEKELEDDVVEAMVESNEKIYIIQENELDDRDCLGYTLYEDGVVIDENGDILEDVDSLLGENFVSKMQISGESSVLVRNDSTYLDYEVCAAGVMYNEGTAMDPDGDEIDADLLAPEREPKPHEL